MDKELLLKSRAAALAAREEKVGESGRQFLKVGLGGESYTLPLERLTGVLTVDALTPVPGSSPLLDGFINVRGDVRPVYDLGGLIDLAKVPLKFPVAVVLLSLGALEVGFRVDFTEGTVRLREVDLGEAYSFCKGRTREGLNVLDLDLLLAHSLFKEPEI